MCLERVSEKKVAEKNIFCWKKLTIGGKSLVHDYQYVPGVVQPQVHIHVKERWDSREIDPGYHSWVDQERTDRYGEKHTEKVNHLFVIPKGTVYYEGLENGFRLGYASETIVYVGHTWNPLTWLRKLKYENK
jgi:hypothetical protein